MTIEGAISKTAHGRASLFGWAGWDDGMKESGSLCALGVPTDHGNVVARGAAQAPAAIRDASLHLAPPPIGGLDIGDVDRADARDPDRFVRCIAGVIDWMDDRDLCPLILGGDHSITYAPVWALQRSRDLCLIWLDAHTDFSAWSGHAFHNHKQVLRRIATLDGVRRIVQIGYRGITAGDEGSLGSKAVVVPTVHARQLDARALLALVPSELPCYISIDIDVVDPFWAPGTSAPVPDGLLPHQVTEILEILVRHRQIIGVDLVEANPTLDQTTSTSMIAADLIRSMTEQWSDQRALVKSSRSAIANTAVTPGDRPLMAGAARPIVRAKFR